MKELVTYILEGITGVGDFDINITSESDRDNIEVKVPSEHMGLIIGKGGTTIKAIQTILRVRGRLENKFVNLSVIEALN